MKVSHDIFGAKRSSRVSLYVHYKLYVSVLHIKPSFQTLHYTFWSVHFTYK